MTLDPAENYLTTTEVALRLRLHPQTIRRWIKAQGITAVQVNRRKYLIAESELQRYLAANTTEASS